MVLSMDSMHLHYFFSMAAKRSDAKAKPKAKRTKTRRTTPKEAQ